MTPTSMPPANSQRIIVADDHEWIRKVLVEVTSQTLPTAEVIEAVDGLQAFNAYREGCHFLVTNHNMPIMDGMALIRKVRELTPKLPILMVSVHPEAKADAMLAGADWFLTKEQIMEQMPNLLLQHAGRMYRERVGKL